MAAKPTRRERTSPAETLYSEAAPVLVVIGSHGLVRPDIDGDVVVVVDAVVVTDEVDVAVVVAETVGAAPMDPGVATGAVATIEDSRADASERADEAADGSSEIVVPLS